MAEDAETDAGAEAEGEDAPEQGGDAEAGADGKKKPNLVKLGLMIGLPVVILLLAGAGGALLFLGGGADEAVTAEAGDGEQGGEAGGGADVHTYSFEDPIIVQLNVASGQPQLLSMRIALESRDPELSAAIDEHMQRVLDRYAAFLRELTPDDLSGSAGMHRVRMELLRRSRLALGEDAVEDVLVTEMLVTNS